MTTTKFIPITVILGSLALSACATGVDPALAGLDPAPVPVAEAPVSTDAATNADDSVAIGVTEELASDQDDSSRYEVRSGSGQFISSQAARRGGATTTDTGDIVLNFERADIREVLQNILGDMLGLNYVVDPAVAGTVSLVTSRPITRDAVLPTLETMLRINGAVLTRVDGVYLVSPRAKALGGLSPRLNVASNQGYQVLVVPLRYIAAEQMKSILEPLLPEASLVSVDSERNLLVLAGTQVELQQAVSTVDVFDVDQMRGMSIGLFRLQNAEANSVTEELQQILDTEADGILGGMVRFVTIERLNAVIVISGQSRYIEESRYWIERLDRADQAAGQNMYVYPVQNGRAENLANLLSDLFGASSGQSSGNTGSGTRSPSPTSPSASAGPMNSPVDRVRRDDSGANLSSVRIIADTENNALVIMATRADYAKILSAVRRLDVLPLQVLVEATIIEVSLTDELSYGLQWFFKNGIGDFNGAGELFPLPVDPSFSYTVSDPSGGVRAVLNMLAADSRLDVLSSPSLMVLDNQTATIKVGDQVPVRTSETTSLASSGTDPLVTSTIQYRDTGVMLEVTPRVNPGGMVMLEITQDVNDVDQTTTSAIDSPTIVQRQITTSVAVQSGETVILGGLIRNNESESQSGVPGLRSIPLLGRLFSSTKLTNARTELVVLITPTAIANLAEAREATMEMERKLSSVDFAKFDAGKAE